SYLRAMLNWAVGNDLIEANPTNGMQMPTPKVERDRALGDSEIRLLWAACDRIGWPFGPLIQLLLLTAQRRDELAAAGWGEVGRDRPRQRALDVAARKGKERQDTYHPPCAESRRTSSPAPNDGQWDLSVHDDGQEPHQRFHAGAAAAGGCDECARR